MKKEVILRHSYKDFFLLSFVGVLLLLTLVKLHRLYQSDSVFTLEGLAVSLIALSLAYFGYLLNISKLKIEIGKKKMRIRLSPFGLRRTKIKKSEIDKVSFFKTNPVIKASGFLVHFGNDESIYDMGGNEGMTIQMRNGKRYTLFSNNLSPQIKSLGKLNRT